MITHTHKLTVGDVVTAYIMAGVFSLLLVAIGVGSLSGFVLGGVTGSLIYNGVKTHWVS